MRVLHSSFALSVQIQIQLENIQYNHMLINCINSSLPSVWSFTLSLSSSLTLVLALVSSSLEVPSWLVVRNSTSHALGVCCWGNEFLSGLLHLVGVPRLVEAQLLSDGQLLQHVSLVAVLLLQ